MRYIHKTMLLILASVILCSACLSQEIVRLSSCDETCAEELKKRALGGDVESAKRLSTLYQYVNPSEVRYWDQIAAENGDPIAQRSLAISMLVYSDDRLDHIRGLFWLKKSASSGNKQAIEDLSRYEKEGREGLLPPP